MALQKRMLLIPALPIMALTLCGVLAANARFIYRHPFHPEVEFELKGNGGPRLVLNETAADPPRIVVEGGTLYDFGAMDPSSSGAHEFVIRNEGAGPLKISDGGTSCKCTVAEIAKSTIEPGEQSTVKVEFHTGRDKVYFQTITLNTNDPLQKSIRLQIRGEITVLIGAEPAAINFGRLVPTESLPPAKTLVFSQKLRDLRVLGVESSVEGAEWRTEEAAQDALAPHEALGGFWMHFTPPPTTKFKPGTFTVVHQVKVEGVNAEGQLCEEVVRVGYGGQLTRRFTVYGKAIDATGLINLGNVPEGQAKRARLIVKIRDPEPQLDNVRIQTTPSFVKASWERKGEDMYLLDLEVPENAPVGNVSNRTIGSVELLLDHERIEHQRFPLEFDVIPRGN
ncbi:MAG: DUF1573 domain-containing protein [Planctomycetales bacterium]|nr:DUF1573 domain-containing protein [Planctomycetales bacterium]